MDAGRESSPAAAGAAVEDALLLRHLEGFPPPEYFSSVIEPANVPAVFVGAVKDWKACASWDPRRGGLDYLLEILPSRDEPDELAHLEQVGSSTVEAMLSRSAPIFYGDLKSHERVPVPFSTFITTCKLNPIMGNKVDSTGIQEVSAISTADGASHDMIDIGQGFDMGPSSTSQASTPPTASEQLYLAQVPILNIENKEGSTLESLSKDINMPIFLESKPLVSVNFWMNNTSSRSSTHYDPHHNLLCVVAGCKQVVLWPPSASRFLYPMPVYGEASNHSSVDIQNADLSLHSRAKYSLDYSQKAILHAGDALFIPEGWFHQVDSDDLTIGVNLWWQSNIMANMLEHMDAYYLRRILNRLVGKETDRIKCFMGFLGGKIVELKGEEVATASMKLLKTEIFIAGHGGSNFSDKNKESEQNAENHGLDLNQMEAAEVQALHEIVSVVHDTMNVAGQCKSVRQTSCSDREVSHEDKCKLKDSCAFEDDPIASILWTLKPLAFQKVFLAMVYSFPRTLEAFILHMLSPMSAEVLTRKFDEMDQQTTKRQQNELYKLFYSVFEDPSIAMNSILNGKESFAFLAFRNVLDQYLGTRVSKQQ